MTDLNYAVSEDGNSYSAIGGTAQVLEPGYWDTAVTQSGQSVYSRVPAREDVFLEFPNSASSVVLDGIRDFWKREDRFKAHGLPFKRGILLHGPPGTGKTCTLQIVAREVVADDGVVFIFRSVANFLYPFREFRLRQPDTPAVVLMEDFESIVARNSESALLNMLDGVEALQKCVFLASTNYPEKLEERILNRPSRFDVVVEVGYPEDDTRRAYVQYLAKDCEDVDVERLVRDTDGMSLAHVLELFTGTHLLGGKYEDKVADLQRMNSQTLHSAEDRKSVV